MSAIVSSRPKPKSGKARAIGAGLFLAGVLAGCATSHTDHASRVISADTFATAEGFEKITFPHGLLPIVGYEKASASQRLVIFVEGDGASWETRRRVSADPTPRQFAGLKIAANIKNAQVIYLGRPCQYVTQAELTSCDTTHWTDRRFSPEVMDRYQETIGPLIKKYSAGSVEIAGYSGGGVIAAVLAARLENITHLVTIAAPLDTASWVRYHGVSPLTDPVDPMSYLTGLCAVPQTHYYGEQDRIVPFASVALFQTGMQNCRDAHFVVVAGQDHGCCWTAPDSPLAEHWNSSHFYGRNEH